MRTLKTLASLLTFVVCCVAACCACLALVAWADDSGGETAPVHVAAQAGAGNEAP